MTTALSLRLQRRLTLAQFKHLCEQLRQIYPGWREQKEPQTEAWVQVAYNGNTILINPLRDYVLEPDVAGTVHRLLNELPAQSPGSWFMAGTARRRTSRRGSPLI